MKDRGCNWERDREESIFTIQSSRKASQVVVSTIERNQFLQYNQATFLDMILSKEIERNQFLQYNQAYLDMDKMSYR